MNFRIFLSLVEIRTKTASQFPFVFGTLFAIYRYGKFNLQAFLLMFASLLLFDMTTTAVNNFIDYRKSEDEDYRKKHNIIGMAGLSEALVLAIIIIMLTMAAAGGIVLSIISGPVVLLIGGFSFFVGIFYTFGPIPISRMPLGEILSGFFMGFVILFLSVYIHELSIAVLGISLEEIFLRIDLPEAVSLFIVSIPFLLSISNLMLANNICDLEQDIKNDRYLLPYYIGINRSLKLFTWSYYLIYVFIAAAVVLRILPVISLLMMLTLFIVRRQIRVFIHMQSKEETFKTAVINLTVISLGHILPLVLILLYKFIMTVLIL